MKNFREAIFESVNTVADKVRAARRADTLVMAMFSDIHVEAVDAAQVFALCETLQLIKERISPDVVIDLGDNTAMLGRNKHIKNNDLEQFLKSLFDRFYSAADAPVIFVNGNHDGVGTDFFDADFWNGIVKDSYGVSNAVYGSGSYFYTDFKNSKTRIVVLSVPSGSDLTCDMPTPFWCYGEKQLEWLRDTALNTDYDIILLCHVPPYDYYTGAYGPMDATLPTWDGEKERFSTIASLCGWTDDKAEMANIVNAHSRSKILGIFSGHTHKDSYWQPFEVRGEFTNPLCCAQVVMKGSAHKENDEEILGMAVDIAVWTKSENTFKIFRVCDGVDREIAIK